MDIRGIDPRDTAWEQDHARYRVHFWDVAAVTAYKYELIPRPELTPDALRAALAVVAPGRLDERSPAARACPAATSRRRATWNTKIRRWRGKPWVS
ncbi:hypothetical protein ACFWP5_32060 [Streptomyces sp. NPDC058469]|uniref:hypothetical protein n=1 Tax=Streptomyces sp. NPDC058469 TaxID=3346514 RepID=UPI0036473781